MSIDLSSLSTDTLLYFLTHSTVFVVSVASVFFIFGLAFGWLTWGRLKWQRRRLLAESESLKDEVATLKRKLAEQAARLSSLSENAAPAEEPEEAKHSAPDPVIHSFLSAAAAVLPQSSASVGAPAGAEAATAELPASTFTSLPPPPETKPRLVSARDLAQNLAPARETGVPLPDAATAAPAADVEFTTPGPVEIQGPERVASPALPPSVYESNGAHPAVEEDVGASPKAAADVSGAAPVYAGNGEARLISDPHLGLIYASRPSLADDLNHLKGVAHVIEGRLNEFGVYTFKQIALWNDENISEFSHRLSFKDRIRREKWVEQARELHFQKYGERL